MLDLLAGLVLTVMMLIPLTIIIGVVVGLPLLMFKIQEKCYNAHSKKNKIQ